MRGNIFRDISAKCIIYVLFFLFVLIVEISEKLLKANRKYGLIISELGGVKMGRIYVRSIKADRLCYETDATNMIRDILIMFGIYYSYIPNSTNQENDFESFKEYYEKAIAQHTTRHFLFRGEYHFYNSGVQKLRNIATEKGINTSGIQIRHLCATHRMFSVKVAKNASDVLGTLFDYITDVILKECQQYSTQISKKYPRDCSSGILGFVDTFLSSGALLSYTKQYEMVSVSVKNKMYKIAEKFDLKSNCGRRR